MPLEFPAVSQSRVEFWGKPQYTQKGMLLFTVLFGFFGLHHFLLRSPQTGLLILIANLITLGYPYFFDIIQLSTKTHEELQEKGLDLPWSVAGIAQGMWMNPDTKEGEFLPKGPIINALKRFGRSFRTSKPEEEDKPLEQVGGDSSNEAETEVDPPNPYWFFLYSLLLPLAPLSRLIAGDTDNALLGLLNLTIIPLGFIFLAVSIVNEYYMLFVNPADVLYNGIHRVFPFTKFGYAEKGFSPRLTGGVAEEESCEDESVFIRLFKGLYRSVLPAPIVAAIDTVPATAQTVKTQVIDRGLAAASQVKNTVTKVASTAGKVANLATQIPAAASQMQKTIQNVTNPQALRDQLQGKLPVALEAAKTPIPPVLNTTKPNIPASIPVSQSGGGLDTKDKIVTGGLLALILSGFVIHTGRSAWNAIQDIRSESDLPPSINA